MISQATFLGGPLTPLTVAGGFVLPVTYKTRMFEITMSSGSSIKLPDARKVPTGWPVYMLKQGGGLANIQDNGGTNVLSMGGGTSQWCMVGLVDNTTANGVWAQIDLAQMV